MTVSDKLHLSQLPPFALVDVEFEAMRSAHLASLRQRLAEEGIDWDVDVLETDPLVIAVEEITYWRTVDRLALNDVAKSMTLAFAYGSHLDHLAATLYPDLGLVRLAGESDERFRRRVALAAEARSEVTPGAYVFKALSIDTRVADAAALNYASGLVAVGEILVPVLVEAAHMDDEADIIDLARQAILSDRIRLASEVITVRPARPVDAVISATLHLRRGPDPSLVLNEGRARLDAYLAERRRVGRVVSRSGLMAALHSGTTEWVSVASPSADVDPGPDGWVRITDIDVSLEVST